MIKESGCIINLKNGETYRVDENVDVVIAMIYEKKAVAIRTEVQRDFILFKDVMGKNGTYFSKVFIKKTEISDFKSFDTY